MRIAVDLDDVVLDFVGGLREALRKEYGVEIPEDAIKDFNLRPYLDPIIGRSWWAWMEDRQWLWANFPAVDGAIGTLDKLRRDGHYLELLTSKPKWAEHNVYKWLGKWRPPFQQVTIVGHNDNKADFSDSSLLIDDKWENVEDFSNAGREALLFTRPHNEKFNRLPDRVVRVRGWGEAYDVLTRRSKNGSL